MIKKCLCSGILGLSLLMGTGTAFAGADLMPFYLASQGAGDVAAKVTDTKAKLTAAGFEVVGEYSPYAGTTIIVVTNDKLKSNAAKSGDDDETFGGFGAAIRVGVTTVGGKVQVAYTNPVYMAHSYRMKDKLKSVEGQLKSAIGKAKAFGSEDGVEDEDLEDWHYMMGMPYFDEPEEVGKGSHAALVAKIEKNLAAKKAGASKVFRIDIPGKQQVLFGVALANGDGADKTVMGEIDKGALRHSAHLPYGLLVSKGIAYTLQGEYRIASSFPDLSMGQFMGISSAPKAIVQTMEAVAK
ncbi:MAG: hypothetical protein HN790_09285 [Methylococcales bacterium]|jgi:hypothetical protein|nr:hypothetical protein [Methylococcales bacterium]